MVRASAPLPFCSLPEKVCDEPSPPVVSVAIVAGNVFVTMPAPESEPTVWLAPNRSSVPPLARMKARRGGQAPLTQSHD